MSDDSIVLPGTDIDTTVRDDAADEHWMPSESAVLWLDPLPELDDP